MKTATELGISNEHHAAFQEFAARAERGDIPHIAVAIEIESYGDSEGSRPTAFNMDYWCSKRECDTVSCIGGWVEYLSRRKINMLDLDYVADEALSALFYPDEMHGLSVSYNHITPQHAARVVRHYLETGIVDWSVMHG